MKHKLDNRTPRRPRPKHYLRYLLILVVGIAIGHAESVIMRTDIQCDPDTIIKAHYAEVIDAVRVQRHYFNPAYDAPERKPNGNLT